MQDRFDYFIIDVDKVGHHTLDEKKDALVAEFGEDILTDGTVDRKKLGPIVFKNKSKLKLINSIVHPAMIERVKITIDECNKKYICIDAAVLFEMGLDALCSTIIVVKAPLLTLIKRGKKRDNHSLWRIISIIKSQKVLKLAKKNLSNADILYINNNQSIDVLTQTLDKKL